VLATPGFYSGSIAGAVLYTFGLVGIAMALSRWRQK